MLILSLVRLEAGHCTKSVGSKLFIAPCPIVAAVDRIRERGADRPVLPVGPGAVTLVAVVLARGRLAQVSRGVPVAPLHAQVLTVTARILDAQLGRAQA